MPEPREPVRLTRAREFLTRCFAGDFDQATPSLAHNAVYYVPGAHLLAGEFHGAEEIVRHLTNLLTMTRGRVDVLKWDDWMVGNPHVTVLQHVQAQYSGSIYEGRQLYLLKFDVDDLITEIRVFFEDQARADRFFGRLSSADVGGEPGA